MGYETQNKIKLYVGLAAIAAAGFAGLLIMNGLVYAQSNQEAATGQPVCGDGVISGDEECDGANLGGFTCAAFGYTSGTLSCNADCTFNVSQCAVEEPAPPPPSGGGGGGIIIPRFLPPKPPLPTGDFNNDGRVNYKDLSVLLYWWGKTGAQIAPYDLNGDGKIDWKDVSILLYRWRE